MAKLKYTFDDYVKNPSGKGSAVSGTINREQYEKDLMALESKNAKVTYTVYRQTSGTKVSYFIHFLIPSSTKNFFHDVVIEFVPNSDDSPTTKSIKAFIVKFFANDSNFVYTYAYTFKTHGVLINELEKLLPYRSIIQKPSMRNPDNAMGYNKNIVFAYLVMIRDGLFAKETLSRICKNAGVSEIRNNISSFDRKERQRYKMQQEEREAAKKEKSVPKNKVIKSKNLLGDSTPAPPKISKIVNKIDKTSKVSGVKKSKKR